MANFTSNCSVFLNETENNENAASVQFLKDGKPTELIAENSCHSDVSLKEKKFYTISVYKKYKISINKVLLPFRIAQILWFGAGRVAIMYLSVFIKHRGVSLVEFSSVFSITFIMEFLTASVSGIVADKIGNAKPVLMFHQLFTFSTVVAMLLSPNINSSTCELIRFNLTCGDYLKSISLSYTNNSLENCTWNCFSSKMIGDIQNGTLEIDINNNVLYDFENTSQSMKQMDNITLMDNTSIYQVKNENKVHNVCKDVNDVCIVSCNSSFESDCKSTETIYLTIYIILILSFISSFGVIYRLLDITAMSLLSNNDSHFGYERAFGICGEIVIMFSAGLVLKSGSHLESHNYDSVYWFAAGMIFLSFISVWNVRVNLKPPCRNMWKEAIKLMKGLDTIIVAVIILVLGNSFCFFQSYTLWYIEYLKAPGIIYSLFPAIICIYGLPFSCGARWWIKNVGMKKMLLLGHLGYVISGLGYSLIHNPWWSLLICSTHILTYFLLWVAVVMYSYTIAPKGLTSTVTATFGAIHFAIGRSSGTFIGGQLMNAYGPRATFRVIAALNFSALVFFAAFLYFRRNSVVHNKKRIDQTIQRFMDHNI